jgi:hypothetical protein
VQSNSGGFWHILCAHVNEAILSVIRIFHGVHGRSKIRYKHNRIKVFTKGFAIILT